MPISLSDLGSFVQEVGRVIAVGLPQLLPLVLVLALLALVFVAVRSMPRTKPQRVRPEANSSTSFDDVAGIDEAKDELREVVEFLREGARFRRLGARVPQGILLHGPPGTGKTLLAKAVARESGATFFSQSAASFVELYAGLGASRIRRLFETARKHAPAIVFIDELDAVGAVRSGTSTNREQDQTLNQLLVELDGFRDISGVVVIAASNRLDTLDPALLRPGRFDRQVHVAPPDVTGREAILRVHTRTKPLAVDVDLRRIARQSAGLVGADLENICNEAAIRTGRRRAEWIEMQDFDWAVERVVGGLQTARLISEKEKRVIAFHEGGHALLAHVLGDGEAVQKVTIVPRGQTLGFTLHLPEEDRYLATREELLDKIRILLAGRAAEHVVFGRITTGASADLERATWLAHAMVTEYGMGETVRSRTLGRSGDQPAEATRRLRDEEEGRITDVAYADAIAICERHRAALDRIADALLERETLDRGDVRELLAGVAVESDARSVVGVLLVPGETN